MARAYHLVREHAVKYLSILIISMVLMVFASCELQLEQEPNEFFPDANRIPPQSMQIKGNITYDEIEPDIDSFYMQLSPGKYEFSLINLTEDLQLMLYIRDIDTGFVIGGPTRSDNARMALLAGLACVFGFAPFGIFPIPVIALAVLFLLWCRAESPRRA
ncbi:MAG: hypothetical protein PHU24_10480, partial [Sphaerochaetaceae bacterium]|nr:hypothetical protein [Sphaerochaetaceae bacterium]